MFDGKLYVARDICKDEEIPKDLKVPIKSKTAKAAAKMGWKACCTVLLCLIFHFFASSSNSLLVLELPTKHGQEFKLVWTRKKKFHTLLVEMACTQWHHHISIGLTPPALCMHHCSAMVLWCNPPPPGRVVTSRPPPPDAPLIEHVSADEAYAFFIAKALKWEHFMKRLSLKPSQRVALLQEWIFPLLVYRVRALPMVLPPNGHFVGHDICSIVAGGAHPVETLLLSWHLLQSFFARPKTCTDSSPHTKQCANLPIWHSILFKDTIMSTCYSPSHYSPSLLRKGIRTVHRPLTSHIL